MYDFDIDWPIVIISLAIVVIFALFITAAVHDGQQWAAFKSEHKCHPVAHIKGEVFNTFGVDGKGQLSVGIGSTSDKTGWLCDDGQTYYR